MATEKDIKIINNKSCLSSKAICEILNISEETLTEWEKAGCPKEKQGWWIIKDVLEWRGFTGSGLKNTTDIERKSLNEQKLFFETKYKQAQYETIDIQNAVERGDYIAKNTIISEFQRGFLILKRSMLGFSRKAAMEASPFVGTTTARRIEKLISLIIHDALNQISEADAYDTKKAQKTINNYKKEHGEA